MVESCVERELMNASLRAGVASHTDCLTRAFAGARIRLGALATNGQAAQVTDAAIAFDTLQALEIHADFAAEIAFDHILTVLDGVDDLRKLGLGEIFGANLGIDLGAGEDLYRVSGADAVNVTQRN